MNPRILFVFASRSRPQKFEEALDSIIKNVASMDYLIECALDLDDEAMLNHFDRKTLATGHHKAGSNLRWGMSKNKIDAINREDGLTKWAHIICAFSDDMRFITPGFDNIIRDAFRTPYQDKPFDLDQCIHFNDGNQGRNCMTMSIMGRTYYDRFGYIYHPSYESLWCDLEAQEVAQKLGKYKYMGDDLIIFNHLHPSFGLSEYDEQYRRTEDMAVRTRDHENYLKRKANNFYISDK